MTGRGKAEILARQGFDWDYYFLLSAPLAVARFWLVALANGGVIQSAGVGFAPSKLGM